MKLKNILFVLSAGIGMALPAAMATASSSTCLQCERAWDDCLNRGYTVIQCNRMVNCMLC